MIAYHDTLGQVTVEQLTGFFVGWPSPPSPATHLRLLRNSAHVVLAIYETGEVVGFVTALSDGILAASISLLEVKPAYQGQGIGTELMRWMLSKLEHLYMVDLGCDPALQPFYARVGMVPSTGMMLRHYRRQAGG